jgi:hypothetical protein
VTEKYRDALHEAQAELVRLDQRRSTLHRLIETLKILAEDDAYELVPPEGYEPKGLTDEIRTILSLTTQALDATQIRDALIKRGFKHSNAKNLLINVHTVLGRIKEELDEVEKDGKPAYRAKSASQSDVAGWNALLSGAILANFSKETSKLGEAVAGLKLSIAPDQYSGFTKILEEFIKSQEHVKEMLDRSPWSFLAAAARQALNATENMGKDTTLLARGFEQMESDPKKKKSDQHKKK